MPLENASFISDLIVTNPSVGDYRSTGDDHLRLLKAVLQNTFPSMAGAMNASQADLNLLTGINATPTLIMPIPVGTVCLFYQAAAPTGWTQVTNVNDKVLRVVSGTGGGSGGSWTISGLTVDSHTLVAGEIPAHTHALLWNGSLKSGVLVEAAGLGIASTNSDAGGGSNLTSRASLTLANTGGGGGHTHTISSNGSWRPAYINVIQCKKAAV